MKGGTIGLLKVVVELMLNAAECPMVRVGHASPFLFNDRFLASDSQQRVELRPSLNRPNAARTGRCGMSS